MKNQDEFNRIMNQENYRHLMDDIPMKIRMIGNHNAAVRKCIEMYARGQIVTREEALCQMVVLLSENWELRTKELFDMHQKMSNLSMVAPVRP